MSETPDSRPFRSIAEGIVAPCEKCDLPVNSRCMDCFGQVDAIEKALEALAAEKDLTIRSLRLDLDAHVSIVDLKTKDLAEKDGFCRQMHVEIGKLTESGWKLLREKDAELASLRSEVERLRRETSKGIPELFKDELYEAKNRAARAESDLSLAIKERDAYREIALAGIETLNGGVLTKGLIEATDAQAKKLSSEGKK